MNTYDVGDTVLCDATSTYDPAAVSFTVKPPTGSETTYVYGTDEEVTAISGGFRLTIEVQVAGTWRWLVEGTGPSGTPTGTEEHRFLVREPQVTRHLTAPA